MRTIRLRFVDEAAALDALRSALTLAADYETSVELLPPIAFVDGVRCDIDMIGTLYEQTGVDEAGEPITSPLSGYHVNLLWWGDGPAPPIGGDTVTPDPALREWLL